MKHMFAFIFLFGEDKPGTSQQGLNQSNVLELTPWARQGSQGRRISVLDWPQALSWERPYTLLHCICYSSLARPQRLQAQSCSSSSLSVQGWRYPDASQHLSCPFHCGEGQPEGPSSGFLLLFKMHLCIQVREREYLLSTAPHPTWPQGPELGQAEASIQEHHKDFQFNWQGPTHLGNHELLSQAPEQ